MNLPSHAWASLKTTDFAQLAKSPGADHVVAVLPVAAIEQHGPHLPLSVDATLLQGVIDAALPQLAQAHTPALFLPMQAVGKSNEHIRFAGTLSLSAQTLMALWTDIGESVARAGVKKLLLLNSHGGQVSMLDIVARDLRSRLDLLTVHTSWFNLPLGADVDALFSPEEQRFGIHGGEVETSMMLALAPQLVDMRQAQNFVSSSQLRAQHYPILGNGHSAKLGWQMQDYNPQGACGNAAAATAEKGQAVLAAAGLALATLLKEISSLPMSTLRSQAAQ